VSSKSIVTIDGPVASGKSTVARALAARLGFDYLDSGAMYRALALEARRAGVDLESADALIQLLRRRDIRLDTSRGTTRVFLDGEEVTEDIRTPELTELTRFVADCGELRPHMVAWQRELAADGRIVAEGRDMGTAVFPDAAAKFYLDADIEERVRRRAVEWAAKGIAPRRDRLRREIQARDHRDRSRPVSPLRVPEGACVIDSTDLSADEVVERMLSCCRRRLAAEEGGV